MSLPIHIALVSEGVDIPAPEITKVAASLSKQIQRDFAPIWNVDATVAAFLRLEDVPVDYWPIIVMRDVQDAAGYHQDEDGQPFAVVEFSKDWSVTASHELLEMLADPFGRRMKAGNLPDQAIDLELEPKRVRYLVEVCDPSEDGKFGYQINGIAVSDFYTPHFFDPVKAAGVRYSFTGAIDEPRKILKGGYISWLDPVSKHWFQLRMFADSVSTRVPHVVDLNTDKLFEKLLKTTSLRSAVDRVTPSPKPSANFKASVALTAKTFVKESEFEKDQEVHAKSLRQQVGALLK